MKRQTICLCGSGRFFDEILQQAAELTLRGYVVLQPNFNASKSTKLDAVDKMKLDELHFDKIDMSDEIGVLCPGGYVGESTAREIFYARRTRKPVVLSHHAEFVSRLADENFVKFLLDADTYVTDVLRRRGVVCTGVELNARGWIDELREEQRRAAQSNPVVQAAGRMHHERTKLLEQATDLIDALEAAWGVIANGPWSSKSEEKSDWTKAAERWRDRYHELLRSDIFRATLKIRALRSLQDRFNALLNGLRVDPKGTMSTLHEELKTLGDVLRQAWDEPQHTA